MLFIFSIALHYHIAHFESFQYMAQNKVFFRWQHRREPLYAAAEGQRGIPAASGIQRRQADDNGFENTILLGNDSCSGTIFDRPYWNCSVGRTDTGKAGAGGQQMLCAASGGRVKKPVCRLFCKRGTPLKAVLAAAVRLTMA
jgi:hypothetical protein